MKRSRTWFGGGLWLLGVVVVLLLVSGWPSGWSWWSRIVVAAWVPSWLWCWHHVRLLWQRRGSGNELRWDLAALLGWAGMTWLCALAWFHWVPTRLEMLVRQVEVLVAPERAAERALEESAPVGAGAVGHWLWGDGGTRRLPERTDLKPGTKPEVFIAFRERDDAESLMRGRAYVQAFALERYRLGEWSAIASPVRRHPLGSDGWVRFRSAPEGKLIEHEVFHAAESQGRTPLIGLQGLVAAAVGPLEQESQGIVGLPSVEGSEGYQYRVISRPMRIEDLPTGRWVSPKAGGGEDFLQVEERPPVREALQDLVRPLVVGADLRQQLLRLRDALREGYRYSLRTENASRRGPIENFLLHEKRGHCEHFATVAALAARTMGVPARIAYGWSGGTWHSSAGLMVFRANEAHAWAEVWLEPYGWVVLDGTPAGSVPTGRVERQVRSLAAEFQEQNPNVADSASVSEQAGKQLQPLIPAGMGCMVLALGCWHWRRMRLRAMQRRQTRRELGLERAGRHIHEPDYLRAWRDLVAGQAQGVEPGMPLRQQLEGMEPQPWYAERLWRYHYGVVYEGQTKCAQTERALFAAIRGECGPDTTDEGGRLIGSR